MRAFSVVVLCLGTLPRGAAGQAPELAHLWRVAAATLSQPAALERGPTGVFWNPAAVHDVPGFAGGIEVLQTPDVVSLSGVMGGLTQHVTRRLAVGVLAGRVSVKDLVRTTTSPTSELGEIPVYSQLLGVAAGARVGSVAIGTIVRAHDARFDTRSESGVTLDFGVRVAPLPQVTVAAASRFAPAVFGADVSTDYGIAAEYGLKTATVWGSQALVLGRYGASYRKDVGVEHQLSAGVALEDRLRVDLGWTRELGFGTASWRSVVSIALHAGRYVVSIARGAGLNDVGATFRLSLNAGILP